MNLPGLSMDSVTAAKAASIERDYKMRKRGKDPREEEAKQAELKNRREARRTTAAAPAPAPKLTVSEKNKIVDTMTQKRTDDENKKKCAKLRKIRRYHEEFPHLLGPPPKLNVLSEGASIDAALEHCRHTMSSKNAAKQVRQLPIMLAGGIEYGVRQGYDPMGWGDKVKGLKDTMQAAIHEGEMETALTEMCIELEDWASTPAWFRLASQFFLICNMHVMGQRAREKMAEAANDPSMQERLQAAMRRFQESAENIRKQREADEKQKDE